MQLYIECVRDVLLEFELFLPGCYTPYDFIESIKKHGINNVEYTIAKLNEAKYINADIHMLNNGHYDYYGIYDITFDGHEFLSKIRDENIWKKLKTATLKGGTASLKAVGEIALQMGYETLKQKFGLK